MTRVLLPVGAIALLVAATSGRTTAQQPPPVGGGGTRAVSVVAQDGSGDYRTIQAALDAVPPGNASLRTIVVRKGTYQEKLYVRAGHLAIVGEDRDATRIVFPELRRNWRVDHDTDWGAAVVNIGDRVTDLVIGNLTVHNNYGALHGDHDHQFAIRSGGQATRLTLLSANVIADGGDTLSLWNAAAGMYYHADCSFEGWVDYVCPRGWCYITNSRFFGHNVPSASIWHDGSQDIDARLVIRRSRFDGVPGFPLGRNNRDGQFYLLDNVFSERMADRPIYLPSARGTYRWGERYYYWNNRRQGGDFAWFADNLDTAPGAPLAEDITPGWTFAGRWDPEATLPAVLPFASVPRPEHGATITLERSAGAAGPSAQRAVRAGTTTLRSVGARDARAYRVHFGTAKEPPLCAERAATFYETGRLVPGRTYRWRVDAVTAHGVRRGPEWEFTTVRAGEPSARGAAATRSTPVIGSDQEPRARVRIVLAGDSTVTDESGWGRGFKARLAGHVECINLAKNGRSTKSYAAEGLWADVLKRGADYILIQFGHNDQPGKGPDRETDAKTTYRDNLSRFVDEARAAGALPVIVTSLARRHFGPDGRIVSDLDAYVEGARQVAHVKNIPLIDLNASSIALLNRLGPEGAAKFDVKKADGTPDRTHLSEAGSAAFGALVAQELGRVVLRLSDAIR